MTPDQEERMVKAYEAIAAALQQIANPPLTVPAVGAPIAPVVVAAPVTLQGVTGTLTVTGDVDATGMKAA